MKPIVLAILGAAALLFLFSCEDKQSNDDITRGVNEESAVETAVQIEYLDSLNDILITTHKTWA